MSFIDELEIQIKAGNGGDGVVRFRREKFKPKGGPSGGNGGKGGDVYIRAVRDSGILAKYSHTRSLGAENGEDGKNNSMHGKDGEVLVIDVPRGSFITNKTDGSTFELIEEGEKALVLRGGNGGLGNEHFKSSINRTPKESTKGKAGEEGVFVIELRIFADGGLMGFPNAGKSSLLNALTNAHSKVGAYEFTTLSPHLGDMYGYILADIPGLIEGASAGKGLGHTFLRHIRRTKILIHCISLLNENVEESYNIIREEIKNYDEILSKKAEIVVLTKTDMVDRDKLDNAVSIMKSKCDIVLTTSIYDDESIKNLRDELVKKFKSL